jgi:hypothetical protein
VLIAARARQDRYHLTVGGHQVVDITIGTESETWYVRQAAVRSRGERHPDCAHQHQNNTVSGHIDAGNGPWWMTLVDSGATTDVGVSDVKLYVILSSDLSMNVVSLEESDAPTAHFPFDSLDEPIKMHCSVVSRSAFSDEDPPGARHPQRAADHALRSNQARSSKQLHVSRIVVRVSLRSRRQRDRAHTYATSDRRKSRSGPGSAPAKAASK